MITLQITENELMFLCDRVFDELDELQTEIETYDIDEIANYHGITIDDVYKHREFLKNIFNKLYKEVKQNKLDEDCIYSIS
jgi:hypothetical protein